MKIGIVIADLEEYRPFEPLIKDGFLRRETVYGMEKNVFLLNGAEIYCVRSNCGKVNATVAATHLIENGCTVLLNFGFSGGISHAARGDLVLADRFLEHDFDLSMIGYAPCEKPQQEYVYSADRRLLDCFCAQLPGITVGTAVSGDRFICNEDDRAFFKENFQAVSCDMETAAVASVCHFAGVPFIALRRISDDAGADAKDSYRQMYNGGETLMAESFYRCLCAVVDLYSHET